MCPQFFLARLTFSPPVGLFRNPSPRLYNIKRSEWGGGAEPVLNGKSAGNGGEWARPMPACLGKSMIQSWRQLRLKKELTLLFRSLCALCTDTAERHPKTWLIPVMYRLFFFLSLAPTLIPCFLPIFSLASCLYLWFSLDSISSSWQWIQHKSLCKYTADVLLWHNVFQRHYAGEDFYSRPAHIYSLFVLV